jgi:hypothetical protein
MTKVLCIYERALDGMAAAWAAHRALGDNVEFVAIDGTEKWDNSALIGRDVLILGDLYPLDVLRAMASEARSVLVIAGQDASEFLLSSVVPTLANYKTWFADDPAEWPGGKLASAVDLSRSTAALTWDYLHPGQPRPRIVDLIGVQGQRFQLVDRRPGFDTGSGIVKEGDRALYNGKPCKVLTVYHDGDVQIDLGDGTFPTVKWRFVTPIAQMQDDVTSLNGDSK